MRRILLILIALCLPASAQFGGPIGGMGRPGAIRGGGLLPGVGGDPLWIAAGPTKPSFDLDFAKRKDLTDAVSRSTSPVSFTRSSMGTYVDSDGLIKRSAVNELLYSEQFDNAAWTKASGATVTANQAIAPDGKQTADKISVPSSNAGVYQGKSIPAGATYSWSIYLKGAAGEIVNVGANISTSVVDYKQVTMSGEWQRVSGSLANTTGSTATVFFHLRSDFPSPAGVVGAFDCYAWGAQLEEGTTATPYIRTTSTISGAPRFDHDPVTGESLGLLVEEARTNQVVGSELFSGTGWFSNDLIITNNAGISPDGQNNATKFEVDTGSAGNYSYYVYTSTLRTNYTISVYAKAGNYDKFSLHLSGTTARSYRALFDLSSGSVVYAHTHVSASIEPTGNGWYRCSVTLLPSVSAFNTVWYASINDYEGNSDDPANYVAASGLYVYFWGAQDEYLSVFPTSYIPTEGSTVTRAADIAAVEGADFSTTNLLAYSESFDVGWTKNDSVAVSENQALSPDGQNTADKIYVTSAGTFDYVYQTRAMTTGQTYTFSVYLKNIDSPSTWLRIRRSASSCDVVITWSGSEISSVTPFYVSPKSISFSDVGDGWYRVNVTFAAVSGGDRFRIYPADYGDTPTTGNIYAWGASLTATEYPVEYTTTRNLLTDSQDFERGTWVPFTNPQPFPVQISTPDGGNKAHKFVPSSSAGLANHLVRQGPKTTIASTPYTASSYIKDSGNGFGSIIVWSGGSDFVSATVDLSNGAVTNSGSSGVITFISATSTDAGNGWYRLDLSFSHTGTTTYVYIGSYRANTFSGGLPTKYVANDIDGSFFFGAQLEPGTVATDYVRTVDTVGKDYRWYEPTEGTVFAEAQASGVGSNISTIAYFSNYPTNSPDARLEIRYATPSQSRIYSIDPAVSFDMYFTRPAVGSKFSASIAYKKDDFAGIFSGQSIQTDGSGDVAYPVTTVHIGQNSAGANKYNGHIKRLTYWPTRQPDATLQVITQ